jgi:hypothetical protein
MQLSLKSLESLESKYTNAKNAIKRAREDANETVMTVVRSAEVSGMAFALGVINGRWGRPELLGIPVDLGLGLAGHTLGFVLDDEAGTHLHNLGDGALASYLTSLGVGIGTKMAQEAGAPQQGG